MITLRQIEDKFGGNLYTQGKAPYIMICCPYHNDSKPSMMVYEDWATCLACGIRKPTNTLLDSGVLVKHRVLKVQNPFRKWLESDTLGNVLKSAWMDNQRFPNQYMEKTRQIPAKEQIRLGIGHKDNWITFPIRKLNGKLCGAVVRAGEGNMSPSKYMVPPKQPPWLYIPDISLLKDAKRLYLCFGIISALSVALLGYPAASTTTGKRLDPERIAWFRGEIVIIPDYKEEQDAYAIAYNLGGRGKVFIPRYDVGMDDPADLYVSGELDREMKRYV